MDSPFDGDDIPTALGTETLAGRERQARYDTDGALKRDVLPLAREFFRPCVAPHPRRIA